MEGNPRFQTWLRGDTNLLWIRGGPGKGKTMMSVYLTEVIASEPSRSLAYHFCVSRDLQRNNACAVLRGLLWQIIGNHPDLMRLIVQYFDPPERIKATVSSEETLWNLLNEICRQAETPRIYCLVDGVDECEEESMHWLIDKFMSVGSEAVSEKLSLIVLSRHLAGLEASVCITLDPDHRGQVSADIALFVQSKVRELARRLDLDADFEANATSVLLEKAEGTFLWVGFVMGELLKKKTRSQVERAMYGLPKGLPAVYARMLQSIEPADRDNSKKLLTCVALAFKPLYLEAIADILDVQGSAAISEEQATLDAIAICAPMLQLRGKLVEFVHLSARDYLLPGENDRDQALEDFRISPEEAHLYLTRRCLQSLAEDTWLQYYSLLNWPKHAKCLRNLAPRLFEQEHPFFEKTSPVRDAWWRKYSVNFPGLPKAVPQRIHIACFIGLETWVRAILIEQQRSGSTLKEIVNEQCDGWIPLNYAAESASEAVMQLLLDCPAGSTLSSEQLDYAVRQALLSQRKGACRLLLCHGANVEAAEHQRFTLLFHATAMDVSAIMQFLVEHPIIDDIGSEQAPQLPPKQALALERLFDPWSSGRDMQFGPPAERQTIFNLLAPSTPEEMASDTSSCASLYAPYAYLFGPHGREETQRIPSDVDVFDGMNTGPVGQP
jgi:hypothetical protein